MVHVCFLPDHNLHRYKTKRKAIFILTVPGPRPRLVVRLAGIADYMGTRKVENDITDKSPNFPSV